MRDTVQRIVGNLARRLKYYRHVPAYLWYHKIRFRITNTKFDISYCVFRESFVGDQYGIRRFLDRIGKSDTLFFLDIGRNHGAVFYYALHHVDEAKIPVSKIVYYGIDPAPLKFVYYPGGPPVEYHLIDKAVVMNDAKVVRLKYGEGNFGNFNVSDSNYEKRKRGQQERYEFIEINVETFALEEIIDLIRNNLAADAMIVKIDCKNQTDRIFMDVLDILSNRNSPYLVASERDGSAGSDVSRFAVNDWNTLVTSNIDGASIGLHG